MSLSPEQLVVGETKTAMIDEFYYYCKFAVATEAYIKISLAAIAILFVHLVTLLLVKKCRSSWFNYSKDRLALKLCLSVSYYIYFLDKTVFSKSGYPKAVLIMLLILITVRCAYAFLRTKNVRLVVVELLLVLGEYPMTVFLQKVAYKIGHAYFL